MKHNYFPYLKLELRKEMKKIRFFPDERIYIDNQRHLLYKGEPYEWYYLAWIDSFGSNSQRFGCVYGRSNSKKNIAF